ncbi:MAG: bacteriohopanetetrol glucosamine biosynthesis glycosyltransferase HpnI, partial [Patescibacteria group bacterium]
MLCKLILLLTAASWVYWLVAWRMVHVFFRDYAASGEDFTPPVSLLKPVKGLDPEAYENFASFCRQDYPAYEILFGVADPDDPCVPVVERLRQEFPERGIKLVVAPALGANRKASILHTLAGRAAHEILVISDSDIRVAPDYLRRVVAPLADAATGLVTCPYRGEQPRTFTARLEALYMGTTFLPSVMIARRALAMRFAMGATTVLRRSDLERIGGFAALADYLADDYQLGYRISGLDLRVHLSDCVVASILGATTFGEQWRRELRWMRCNRVSRPWGYPGLLLSFCTPLALALFLLGGGWAALAVSVFLRWEVAWQVAGYTGDREARAWLAWLPLRDMLSALVWIAGAFGLRVSW